MAQSVYSLNVVGYVNTPVPANTIGNGFAMIGNPLTTANSDLSTVIPPTSVPVNTTVYKWDTGLSTFIVRNRITDDDDNSVWNGALALPPGEGFWVKNPGASTLTLTFVGDVAQGNLTNTIPTGFSQKSSIVPESGDLATALGYPAVVGSTTIYFWRAGAYEVRSRITDDDDNSVWNGATVPLVGEGFWAKENAQRSWVRTFTVAP